MTREEILAFISKNQTCFLATIEGGKPHVRGMMTYRADAEGIIFHTGKTKAIYRQLIADPSVELCFFAPAERIQVRVSGTAEPLEDMDLKREVVENRPFMKPWIEKNGYEFLALFRVTNCTVMVWTFESNFAPTVFNPL